MSGPDGGGSGRKLPSAMHARLYLTCGLLALAPAWGAEVALSNFPATEAAGPQVLERLWIAQGFSLPNTDHVLDSLSAVVLRGAGSGELGARLYGEFNGKPSGILAELTVSGLASEAWVQSEVEFRPSASVVLDANEIYFFALYTMAEGTQFNWARSSGEVVGGGMLSTRHINRDGGVNWSGPSLVDIQTIEVAATAIPEPGSWGLACGAAALGWAGVARRKR